MSIDNNNRYPSRDNEFIAWYPTALLRASDSAVWQKVEAAYYIHIPFCDAICDYCGFAVSERKSQNIDEYIDHLILEIERSNRLPFLQSKHFTVGHFGGGTPSVLEAQQLERILASVSRVIDTADISELTLEANPISLTYEKAVAYRDLGVNRLSIGVQSFNNNLLRAIGRPHRPNEAINTYELARRAGFSNISLDLMYGLPNQTIDELVHDLETCIELRPDHISVFQLERIPMTPLSLKEKFGLLTPKSSDNILIEMHQTILKMLVNHGYHHYGAFNFALPFKESEHNRIAFVAPQGEYIGWGNGAYSFMNDCVFCNDVSIDRYKQAISEGQSATTYCKKSTMLELASRFVILGLKFVSIPRQSFREKFGEDIEFFFGDTLDQLEETGFILRDEESIHLTELGILYVNNVCKEFYVGENRGKKQYVQFEPTISAKTINFIAKQARI